MHSPRSRTATGRRARTAGRRACLLAPALLTALLQPGQAAAAAGPIAGEGATVSANAASAVLPNASNFRDLGGYTTEQGQRVRKGLLFRSESLHRLTPPEFGRLSSLGIRTLLDFRSNEERMKNPVHWTGPSAPHALTVDYALTSNRYGQALRRDGLTSGEAIEIMTDVYRDMPVTFAPQYRQMFAQLLDSGAPLVFYCTGGKDRTGLGAALILDVLGVPRELIVEDYLRSNEFFTAPYLAAKKRQGPAMLDAGDAVLAVVMGADRRFIEASFEAIDARPGGMERYRREVLGIDDRAVVRLRSMFLESSGPN